MSFNYLSTTLVKPWLTIHPAKEQYPGSNGERFNIWFVGVDLEEEGDDKEPWDVSDSWSEGDPWLRPNAVL